MQLPAAMFASDKMGGSKTGVNPTDPRHKNSFNKDTVEINCGVLFARKAVMT